MRSVRFITRRACTICAEALSLVSDRVVRKGWDLEIVDADELLLSLFVFRGRRGNLIKVLWHDGLGCSLYAKRLERGRFIWPSPADGVVPISSAQLGYLLEGIDWRNPVRTWRPERAG